MNKLLIIFCSIFISCSNSNQQVVFLDGKSMDKEKFKIGCKKSYIESSKEFKIFNDNGDAYCECILEKISQVFMLEEVESMLLNSKNPTSTFWKNKKIVLLAVNCMKDIPDNIYDESQVKKNLTTQLLDFITEAEYKELCEMVNFNDFCDCYSNELLNGYSTKELYTRNDTVFDSAVFYAIKKCAISSLKMETIDY